MIRKTGRVLPLRIAAFFVLLVGVVGYARYVLKPPGGPDGASHMHVVFFPLLLAVLALLAVGGATAIAHAWRRDG